MSAGRGHDRRALPRELPRRRHHAAARRSAHQRCRHVDRHGGRHVEENSPCVVAILAVPARRCRHGGAAGRTGPALHGQERLQVQERRRAGERERHGHRSRRPLRAGSAHRKTSSSTTTTSEQEVTHFSAERVPVSLGIVARHERQHGRREDGVGACSRSIASCSIARARRRVVPDALRRQRRTGARLDRQEGRSVSRRSPGSTRAAARRCTTRSRKRCRCRRAGRHRKKAILIISDGNDTNSRTSVCAK